MFEGGIGGTLTRPEPKGLKNARTQERKNTRTQGCKDVKRQRGRGRVGLWVVKGRDEKEGRRGKSTQVDGCRRAACGVRRERGTNLAFEIDSLFWLVYIYLYVRQAIQTKAASAGAAGTSRTKWNPSHYIILI